MKIGFISDSIGKENTGIGYYSLNLLESLYRNGHKITIIDHIKKHSLEKYSNDFLIVKNKFPFLKTLLWHFFLLKKIQSNDFDFIINPSFFPNVLGVANNLIFTVHDLSMILYPQHTKFGKGIYYKFFLPSTLKKSFKILAVSMSTKNDLIKILKVKKEKIEVLYPSLDKIFKSTKSHLLKDKVKNKYLLPDEFYLYVGTIEPRKNIENLFKAFDLVFEKNRIPLVVVGKKGWKNIQIKKVFNKLKHKKEITFTGYVERNELPVIYSLAKIFVFPSFYEGFGFPPLEAMICGCPVIAAKNSSLSEVCGDAVLYVNPNSFLDLSKKIINLSSNEDLMKELSSKGMNWSKNFLELNLPNFIKSK